MRNIFAQIIYSLFFLVQAIGAMLVFLGALIIGLAEATAALLIASLILSKKEDESDE